jgi:hypothetical protein
MRKVAINRGRGGRTTVSLCRMLGFPEGGWISALPWNQAPPELRSRAVEELPVCSSAQDRALAGGTLPSRVDSLSAGTTRRTLAFAVRLRFCRLAAIARSAPGAHRAADQPHGLERRASGRRLCRSATQSNACSADSRMDNVWVGILCITGPTARFASMPSIASSASPCCNMSTSRPKPPGPICPSNNCCRNWRRSNSSSYSILRRAKRDHPAPLTYSPSRLWRSRRW